MEMATVVSTSEVKPIDVDFKNFEELKKGVEEGLKSYQNIDTSTLSSEALKENVKALSKPRKEINDAKLDIQKQCLANYKIFEGQIKVILKMFDETINVFEEELNSRVIAERQKHTIEINCTDKELESAVKYLSKKFDIKVVD